MQVIKKNGLKQSYDFEKIKNAVQKSAARVNVNLLDSDFQIIQNSILDLIENKDEVSVEDMHCYVEQALDLVNPRVADTYRLYRNYKKDLADMMARVLENSDQLNLKVDKSNANTAAALISTKRSLIYTAFNRERYKKFELNESELEAIEDGYIYIHDIGARSDTYNCCLFDAGKILQGGFEWEHTDYNEPKSLRAATNVLSDLILNGAAQQYGGFTVPEIDSILAPYARKSYMQHLKRFKEIALRNRLNPTELELIYINRDAETDALKETEEEIAQAFQGFEHTFNCVASSRGDFPFVTFTGGCEEDEFGQLVWKTALRVRREGQGKPGNKRPAIFPKLVFLYTKELHAPGKKLYDLYKEGVITSAKAMYPDWLSLDYPDSSLVELDNTMQFKPDIAEIFHKYHKFGQSRWLLDSNNNVYENPEWVDSIISPMGCRAYLSPIYESGKLHPVSDSDKPIFHGRFNGGAISLNLPMIYMKAKTNRTDFYKELDYYLDMINNLHIKTYHFLTKLKASCNPVAFCEGGFAKLNPEDSIKPCIDKITFSYGFTALNELQELATKQSLYEVSGTDSFALQVLKHISDYVVNKKKEREQGLVPYIAALYATPAESLCGTQLQQFRKKYGVVKKVSDRAYFTNSFHMWVGEDITPFEKQDAEFNYFHISSGGHIQYCRFPNGDNLTVLDRAITRAMSLGYYFGVNIESSYCGDCGCKVEDSIEECPCCKSKNITTINRVCGYLGYSRVNGTTKMNDAKMAEIKDRKSM